jgi:hypothetical protein
LASCNTVSVSTRLVRLHKIFLFKTNYFLNISFSFHFQFENIKYLIVPEQDEPCVCGLLGINTIVIEIGDAIPFVLIERIVLHEFGMQSEKCPLNKKFKKISLLSVFLFQQEKKKKPEKKQGMFGHARFQN